MSTLELKEVSYQYKNNNHLAVDHVSCRFEPGTIYAITGPSGSGKSTLLSLMAGLDRPTQGEILLDGRSLTSLDMDKYRRESIAMIFQSFQLFPLLTVVENVCYVMELNGIKNKPARERAVALLESVGIGVEKLKKYPSNLSGGEQQRVAIARALASGAGIILADEPTGNLDVANSRNIVNILGDLAHKKGYCVIVVTHDMDIAAQVDQVYQVRDGRLGISH